MNRTSKWNIRRRLLSVILSIAMLVSLLPTTALATEPGAADVVPMKSSAVSQDFVRAFHLDCGRKYFTPDQIKGMIDRLAANNYTHIQLAFANDGFRLLLKDMSLQLGETIYTSEAVAAAIQEGTKTYSQLKGCEAGILSEDDMSSIISYAKSKGISVIPMFNAPGHAQAIINAMTTLGIRTEAGSAANIDLDSESELAFVKALQAKYVAYFAKAGCRYYNFAADEYSFSTITQKQYDVFGDYVNGVAELVKQAGMTPMAYNDGFYYKGMIPAAGFDKDILVCYWSQAAGCASAAEIAAAGHKLVNNNDNWYYVLGDYLYKVWEAGQWGYEDAKSGLQRVPVTTVKTDEEAGSIVPVGSILCLWCDGPQVAYTQDLQSKVYDLIDTMAASNPDYFKAAAVQTPAELAPVTDAATQIAVAIQGVEGDQPAVSVTEITSAYKFNAQAVVSYEVKPTLNGESYTAAGKVSIPIPAKWTNTALVSGYIIDNGFVLPLSGTAANGSYTFAVPHFSEIGLVLAAEPARAPEGIPAYEAGAISQTTGQTEYVLDTDGVDSGARYLIVASGSTNRAMNNALSSGKLGYTAITVSDGKVTSNVTDALLWTITQSGNGYTIKNNNNILYRNNKNLAFSSTDSASWTITRDNGGAYSIYNGEFYLRYKDGAFSLKDSNNTTVRLFKEIVASNAWSVSTTNLGALIAYANGLNRDLYSNWNTVAAALSDAVTAFNNVANPYTTQAAAVAAQNAVNSVAQALHAALTELREKNTVQVTVNCVDTRGNEIGTPFTVDADEDEVGTYTYTYTITPPTIYGYSFQSGETSGTVTGPSTVTLTYCEGTVSGDYIELPVTLIDYRADGLLFDYDVNYETRNPSLYQSYAYSLVRSYAGDKYDFSNSAINGTSLLFLPLGGHRANESQGTASSYDSGPQYGGVARTGLVKDTLVNGMPEYKESVITYVAERLVRGVARGDVKNMSGKNWNDILYNTFLKDSAGVGRSVRGTSTTVFSEAFEGSKNYANIQTAYDLAYYLLHNLYTADTNMATVTDYRNGNTHNMPIYGMGVDAFNSLVLRQKTDSTGTYYYLDSYVDTGRIVMGTESKSIYNGDPASVGGVKFFYPLTRLGYDAVLGDTTDQLTRSNPDTGDQWYPVGANGNFTLRGEAQFVYHQADNLFFTFSGDDDVYLFINGKLALDIGGAHWPLVRTVRLNDVKDACGLKENEVATFTFFYMERCSDASNFSIKTNIELAKRAIEVEKKAYDQDYTHELADGQGVSNGRTVAYDLVVTNKGNAVMENIRFEDTDSRGGSAAFGYGVQSSTVSPGSANENGNGQLGASSTYVIYITQEDGTEKEGSRQIFDSLTALSDAVADVSLAPAESLHVRFLTATITAKASKIISYRNEVKVTASVGGVSLSDEASHGVYTFNIADTTRDYVVDFGLPLRLTGLFDESARDYIANKALTLNPTSSIQFGSLEFDGKGFDTTLIYTPTKPVDAVETIALDVTYNFSPSSTAVLQKTIRIIPATNVYYEDSFVTTRGGSVAAETATWSPVGTATTAMQALDRLGDQAANLYGYDAAYDSGTTFSMGAAMKTTVSANMLESWIKGSEWPTATFTFKGTGFDVISLTDSTSGALFVKVYQGTDTTGEPVRDVMVNNYYGYQYDQATGKWVVNPNASDTLYQIPVMKIQDLTYGTYTAELAVAYHGFFDKTGDNKYSFWLDAIRVYNPLGESDIYKADGEAYPQYIRLHDSLVNGTAQAEGMVFIDGGDTAEISTYANIGPNNEIYLKKGQAVSFALSVPEGVTVSKIHLGAKAPNGAAGLMVGAADSIAIGTATELYYDITTAAKNGAEVTISNAGEGILSLTNLKITFETKPATPVAMVQRTAESNMRAVMAVRAMYAPPVVAETFEPERLDASWSFVLRAGQKATLTVKASEDVAAISVNGEMVNTFKLRTERSGWGRNATTVTYRVFTYSIEAEGSADYEVIAYNEAGNASNAANARLHVLLGGRSGLWGIFN